MLTATRLALPAILGLGLLLTTTPVTFQAGAEPLSQATRDLGTPGAGGVSRTDRFAGLGQANVYTFAMPPGSATVHVYLGDLWYDVDLSLWRLAGSADDAAGRAGTGCDHQAARVAEEGAFRLASR